MRVTYVNHMGTDDLVVDAARVSFSKLAQNYTPDQNRRLINYLATHDHWTPFAHPQITLHCEVPIFVARQDFKHQVGFTRNEVSRRYVDDTPEFYVPEHWRSRPDANIKQGSGDTHPNNETIQLHYDAICQETLYLYEWLIKQGVAPEQARMVLPQSMYTSYYVTGSLAAWARAYNQRIEPTAQKEIQDLAKQWAQILQPLFPVSWEALTDD